MNRKRLRRLAEFLLTVPPHRFDLENFADSGFTEKKCGTTACACGWATVLFKRSGLNLIEDTHHSEMDICYKGLTSIDAAKEFFGITKYQFYYLFVDDFYPKGRRGPKSVSRRITQFLEKTKELKDNNWCPLEKLYY